MYAFNINWIYWYPSHAKNFAKYYWHNGVFISNVEYIQKDKYKNVMSAIMEEVHVWEY